VTVRSEGTLCPSGWLFRVQGEDFGNGNAILRTEFWSSWHVENITYCFSVYPVVDTSDHIEWAESVLINADNFRKSEKSVYLWEDCKVQSLQI
jgi:hypothetical protein